MFWGSFEASSYKNKYVEHLFSYRSSSNYFFLGEEGIVRTVEITTKLGSVLFRSQFIAAKYLNFIPCAGEEREGKG